jgi:hypothetical protein
MVFVSHPLSRKKVVIWTFIMALTLTLCTILISMALVYGRPHDDSQQTTFQPTKWDLDGFRSLVTFGDSYTDESRAWYFNDHGGTAPPPGWVGSVVSHAFINDNLLLSKPCFFLNSTS